jgi:hypothetical protein
MNRITGSVPLSTGPDWFTHDNGPKGPYATGLSMKMDKGILQERFVPLLRPGRNQCMFISRELENPFGSKGDETLTKQNRRNPTPATRTSRD